MCSRGGTADVAGESSSSSTVNSASSAPGGEVHVAGKKEKVKNKGTLAPPKPDPETGGKSKAELRKERSQLQEAQRLAKATGGGKPPKSISGSGTTAGPSSMSSTSSSGGGHQHQARAQSAGVVLGAGAGEGAVGHVQQRRGSGTNLNLGGGVGVGSSAGAGGAFEEDGSGSRQKPTVKRPSSGIVQFDDPKRVAQYDKSQIVNNIHTQKRVPLFAHLPQYEKEHSLSIKQSGGLLKEDIHPAVLRLGIQYASGAIVGSTARCVALLAVLKEFVLDYVTPPQKELSRDLTTRLKPVIRFLVDCRPMAISMGNVIRFFKSHIASVSDSRTMGMSDSWRKETLVKALDEFMTGRIIGGVKLIETYGADRIKDGDVVLTYGKSHVVERVLIEAATERPATKTMPRKAKKTFRVVIADSRPKFEGKLMLERLVKKGIKCSYVMISAVSYVMPTVSKVLLGAAAMFANGTMLARTGTSIVSLIGKSFNVPVLVCCETFKFSDRVQLDSIGFNELGDPNALISTRTDREADDMSKADSSQSQSQGSKGATHTQQQEVLFDWKDKPSLKLLNLNYDLTPAEFISMVISDVGMIPPTSVPVVFREYHSDQGDA